MISVRKITNEELLREGITSWPIWEKEVSRFPYTYDEEERCFFLEGEVLVETAEGKARIEPGDFVIFPAGLDCVWDIRKPVKKHYRFF